MSVLSARLLEKFRSVLNPHVAAPKELTAAQNRTLRAGSLIILGSVSVGMQAGDWPVWSPAVAAAAFLAWTIAYAEATVQAKRR